MEDSSTATGKNAASKQLPKQKWWHLVAVPSKE
jgi:hypothetical protein